MKLRTPVPCCPREQCDRCDGKGYTVEETDLGPMLLIRPGSVELLDGERRAITDDDTNAWLRAQRLADFMASK